MSSRRIITWIFRLGAGLLSVIALLFLISVIVLHSHPRLLLDPVENAVTSALPGSQFTALSGRPSLWPSPGIVLKGVFLRLPNNDALFVESLSCHLDWGALFRRTLSPRLLVLDTVNARLTWSTNTHSDADSSALTGETFRKALEALQGMSLWLHNAHLELFPASDQNNKEISCPAPLLILHNLSGRFRLPAAQTPGRVTLFTEGLYQTFLDSAPYSIPNALRRVDVRLDDILPDASAPLGLRLRGGTLNILDNTGSILENLSLQILFSPPQAHKQQGHLLLDASLRPESYPKTVSPVRMHASLPFLFTGGSAWSLDLNDGLVALDEDSLRLSMTVHADATASGTAHVTHLSLPRWFSFARELPGGLVAALDNLSGELAFTVDTNGLVVSTLRALLAGHTFTGSGSLTDFHHPVLTISASTGTVDANRLLPGLQGKQAVVPVFTAPPLDAPPASPSPEGATETALTDSESLRYDIRLHADEASFLTLSGKALDIAIAPAPSHPETTRLTLDMKTFYGGKASMVMEIAEACTVQLTTSGVSASPLLTSLLPAGTVPKGTLNATAALSGPADDIGTFLKNLSGRLSVEILNGSLDIAGLPRSFSRLHLATAGQGHMEKNSTGPELVWKGSWSMAARSSSSSLPLTPLDLTLGIEGETRFSSSPFMPLGGRDLSLQAKGTVLGANTDLAARLDLSLPQGTAALRNAKGTLAGCTIQGTVNAATLLRSPSWTAQGTLSCDNLPPLLQHLGLSLPVKGARFPKTARLSGSLHVDGSTFRLEGLNGQIDNTSFKGSVSRILRDLPHWDLSLHLGRMNLAPYLGDPVTPGTTVQSGPVVAPFLRSMTMNATLRADELILADIPFQQVSAALTLDNGTLRLSPCSAICCGGSISAAASATARQDNTTASSLSLKAANIDLASLSDAAAADVRLRGKAQFETRLSGVFRTTDQAFAAQHGTWQTQAGSGSFTSLNPRTRKPESTYQIHSATASGTLNNRLVTCNDVRIQGKGFNVRGRGIVDLRANTIDCTLNASLPGVPDMPIRYSGKLSDPTRRINALKTLTGVIGNVGHHAFSLMKDILDVPLSLIR